MHSLEDLAKQAAQGDGASFYTLLEKAFYGNPDAFRLFHQVATSHPAHLYRLTQFFSHPKLSEVVFKIIESPDFDLSPLKNFVETEPSLFMILAGLALERNHVPALKLLSQFQFEVAAYQRAVQQDFQYLAFLCLIAEKGFANVHALLVQLLQAGNLEVFFALVGIAAEGSLVAIHVINDGATLAHLTALPAFVKQYENHPEYVIPVKTVVRHWEFCPLELFNPDSQETLKESGIEALLFEESISEEEDIPLKRASGD
jgi:hypothetical protein